MAISSSQVQAAPTAADSIYTSSGSNAITTVYLCNQTQSSITCNLFLVQSGQFASGTNKIYSNIVIAGDDTMIIESERLLLDTGDRLMANASNSSLVASVSYTEI